MPSVQKGIDSFAVLRILDLDFFFYTECKLPGEQSGDRGSLPHRSLPRPPAGPLGGPGDAVDAAATARRRRACHGQHAQVRGLRTGRTLLSEPWFHHRCLQSA